MRRSYLLTVALLMIPTALLAQASDNDPFVGPAATETYPSLSLRGFTDVNFSSTDPPSQLGGFDLGQFVLHFTSRLSQKVTFFGELTVSPHTNEFVIEVERAAIRFDYSDPLKVSFGRYHTPVSYWNVAFHHGLWLQTTIRRPEMIQFGTTLLPVHFVGVMAKGNLPTGELGLAYEAGVGNGRGKTLSRAGDAGDYNSNRAWVVALASRPASLYPLQVGASVYHDRIDPDSSSYDEWTGSAHLAWTKENPELLSEVAHVQHEDNVTSEKFTTWAYYIQLAYRLPLDRHRWKPYGRYERIDAPTVDPVLGTVDTEVTTAGLRFDIIDTAAFKAEYRNTLRGGSIGREEGGFAQVCLTF